MNSVPTNTGTTIRRRFAANREMFYVRDSGGLWHYWDFSGRALRISNDQDMLDKTRETGVFEVVSEGYVPPVKEPKGLGAVVEVESGYGVTTKFVLADDEEGPDAENWSEIGSPTWADWDYISANGNVRVLSEGI